MQAEIEAKFLRQDHNEMRRKLTALGAICKYKTKLIRRTVFDFPDRRLQKRRAWVRLREELNGTVELMLKQVVADKLGETFEQPVTVGSYEAAKAFLISLGLEAKSEQESKREVWRLGNVEVMLDEWPWAPPFIEIEAPTEGEVKELAQSLALDWKVAKFGGVTPVYTAEYNLSEAQFEALDIPIKFDQPAPREFIVRS